ncbi:TrmH family RNA methyltransferase [Caenispirillum salinarum]|uniref:TrmH family RNA methyltransferase n=1 Tax=Caenispirillum salinarum TaxID=859058 RepID=UPI00384D8B01
MARPPRRPRSQSHATGPQSPAGRKPPRAAKGRDDRRRGAAPGEKPGAARDVIRITGLPAVAAVFERDPDRVERLFFLSEVAGKTGPWSQRMAQRRKPYRIVEEDELARVAGTVLHGGIVAVCRPREPEVFNVAQAAEWARDRRPLVILDGVGNPHNLGAIVRTMAFFGLDRLVISDHPGQAGLSESAHRVAEGGLEWVTLYRAAGLPAVLRDLRAHYHVVGTALSDKPSPSVADLKAGKRPVAVVLGNEEHGLPRDTQKACESILTLSGSGRVQSLNVAATAAILIHAFAAG